MAISFLYDLSVLQLLCLAIIIFLTCKIVQYRYFSSISDIPGPFLAPFGTCYQVLQVFKGKSAEDITNLHEQHGKPLSRCR